MYFIKRFAFCLLIGAILFNTSCSKDAVESNPQLISSSLDSKILNKKMNYKVYLPKYYNTDQRYPVLYFIPDYGGTDDTVISEYGIGTKSDALYKVGKIKPVIIVAVRLDRSFGINSAIETTRFTTESGKTFDKGMYEDYFCKELVPKIDETYNTISSKEGRYIGGYSMGGFAALHISFRHPDMFSKVGGHSPSLFLNEFPDTTVSQWLYPNESTREERDPIYIAKKNELEGLKVYLDTGETDVNIEGCQELFNILIQKGVKADNELFPGTHSRTYCISYMERYLIFYAGD